MSNTLTSKKITPDAASSTTVNLGERLRVTEQGKYIKVEIHMQNPKRVESMLVPKDLYKNLADLLEESYYRFFHSNKDVTIEKEITIE